MSPKQPQYSPVGGDEPSEHDDSSTVVDRESLSGRHTPAGHEKNWDTEDFSHAPHTRRRKSWWRRCGSSMMLQGLLNTILLLLVLVLLLDRRRGQQQEQQRYGQFEGNGDITGFIPPVSQQITTFVPDMGFNPENSSDFFTQSVKEKWLSIVPSMYAHMWLDHT